MGFYLLKKETYSRYLTESATAKFKEVILLVFNSVSWLTLTEDSFNDFGPSQIDKHVDSATGLGYGKTLDSIAALRKQTRNPSSMV